jgi:hypothetical protein
MGAEHWAPPSTDTHAGGPPPLSPPSVEPPLLAPPSTTGLPPPSSPPPLLPLEAPLELPPLPLPEPPPLPPPEDVPDPPSLPFAGDAELPPQRASAIGIAKRSGATFSKRGCILMNLSKGRRGRSLCLASALRASQRSIPATCAGNLGHANLHSAFRRNERPSPLASLLINRGRARTRGGNSFSSGKAVGGRLSGSLGAEPVRFAHVPRAALVLVREAGYSLFRSAQYERRSRELGVASLDRDGRSAPSTRSTRRPPGCH